MFEWTTVTARGRNHSMTSNSANSQRSSEDKHLIVYVVFPHISLLDLAGPLQVFSWARHGDGDLAYETVILSSRGGPILTDTIMTVETEPVDAWAGRAIDTLLIIGGDGVYSAAADDQFVQSISTLVGNAKRVCSVCSGAYLLAATGALDGRRTATHWEDGDALRTRFPDVRVELDPIYIRDGHIWTSAGVTAGTDMALAIVAEDLGLEAALERARALVTYMVRPGGQSQFSPMLERQRRDRQGRFDDLHAWIAANLRKDLRVEDLADQVNMGLRTFHRSYVATMGRTPAKAIEAIRLQTARELLETTGTSIKAIAAKCGFKDAERMRRSFSRQLGISPVDYRQRFNLDVRNT